MDSTQPELADCAAEPIRVPGGIQAHGALVVVDPDSLRILQASANVETLLGLRLMPGQAATIHAIPGTDVDPMISEMLRWLRGGAATMFLRTARLSRRHMQVIGHRTAQGVILEFEEGPEHEGETLAALYPRIGRFVGVLDSLADVRALAESAVREVRDITGFNRSQVYVFDEDWNGTVVAEDNDGTLPSFLGLHFPASDIPAQARELYRLNRLRFIPDVDYLVSPIVPAPSPIDGRPLDMSFAALRSVSPVHLQYMRNMRTAASMSVSLVIDGRLWGLISCHHRVPRRINAQVRAACDMIGQSLALQIGARERQALAERRIELKRVEAALLAGLAATDALPSGLAANPESWLGVAGAAGAAVVLEGEVRTAGHTPPAEQLRRLAAWLADHADSDVFATHALSRHWPEAEALTETMSGLIAASISQLEAGWLMWFRPETVHTVAWGGDPRKAAAPGTDRVAPRRSFEHWQEPVRRQSQPWSAAEIESAGDFRTAIAPLVRPRA